MHTWRAFRRYTTIRGLHLWDVVQGRDKVTLGLCLFGGLFLCLASTGNNFYKYFQYGVKSAVTNKISDKFPFPAITFTNTHALKRDGMDFYTYVVLDQLWATTPKEKKRSANEVCTVA